MPYIRAKMNEDETFPATLPAVQIGSMMDSMPIKSMTAATGTPNMPNIDAINIAPPPATAGAVQINSIEAKKKDRKNSVSMLLEGAVEASSPAPAKLHIEGHLPVGAVLRLQQLFQGGCPAVVEGVIAKIGLV